MYAAISIAWDKLKSEGEVDIFRAVKTIKMNRPDLVENLVGIIGPIIHMSKWILENKFKQQCDNDAVLMSSTT